jgi:hypothetical protein
MPERLFSYELPFITTCHTVRKITLTGSPKDDVHEIYIDTPSDTPARYNFVSFSSIVSAKPFKVRYIISLLPLHPACGMQQPGAGRQHVKVKHHLRPQAIS